MAHVIGCDVGSQSLKGVLIDGDGTIIAEASAPYDLSFPHPGWAEQNPDDWLRALLRHHGHRRACMRSAADEPSFDRREDTVG